MKRILLLALSFVFLLSSQDAFAKKTKKRTRAQKHSERLEDLKKKLEKVKDKIANFKENEKLPLTSKNERRELEKRQSSLQKLVSRYEKKVKKSGQKKKK